MPIDPRMLAQVQALRAQGGPTGVTPVPAAMQPGGGRPMGGPPIPPGPGAAPPQAPPQAQSGLGMGGPGLNSGIPQALQPGAANYLSGMPGVENRFSESQRQGVMADELRQGSLEMPQGKMVGRVYVPADITQKGAKLMQAYVARQKEQQRKEEARVGSEEMSMLRRGYLEALEGKGPSEEATE